MRSRHDLDREGLAALLEDEPRYRVDQVWHGLHDEGLAPEAITTLPRALRARLAEELPAGLREAARSTADSGETVKWVWALADGHRIETVLLHYARRSTVCVSTQAGCAMACDFCATGQAGFARHLSIGEIVEQVVAARGAAGDRRVSNVVFMGMGEPHRRPAPGQVNLIPLNPTPGFGTPGSSRPRIEAFRDQLRTAGVPVTVRANRGVDIDAACGQLAGATVSAPGRSPAG